MTQERSLPLRAVTFMTVAAALVLAAFIGCHSPTSSPEDANKPRADIIRIDGLKQFGSLERPAVVYLHEKHTQVLAKKSKDCATCHLFDKKYMSTKFMRLKDASKQQAMDIYHTNCTACHRQTAAAGEKAGPVACNECHVDREIPSSWTQIGMDKSLHYRHLKAQENKCEVCHHQVDLLTKKLVYVKGKEDSCRNCHLDQTVDNVISMRLASHEQCIDCHRKRLAQNQDAGPAFCGGCHDATVQKKIQKLKDVPRLMRGQPDATIIQAVKSDGQKVEPFTRMSVVPFNHIGHETYNDTCRACHHSSMDACGKCHLGPDHPQMEVYKESKHGILYEAFRDKLNMDRTSWVVGKDYTTAPTCSTSSSRFLAMPMELDANAARSPPPAPQQRASARLWGSSTKFGAIFLMVSLGSS